MTYRIPTFLWVITVLISLLLFCAFGYFAANEMQRQHILAGSYEQTTPYQRHVHPDSLTWRNVTMAAPWEARDSAEAYEWNGKLYLFGGLDANESTINGQPDYMKAKYFNDLWESSDGENWTLVTEHTELPPLRSMSIVPFNGKLYLYAGWGPTIGFNTDIWQSDDGVHWEKSGAKIPFPAREGQRVLPTRGKLYVFGGVNYQKHITLRDVWESSDGLHWDQLTPKAQWAGRWDYDAADFNNAFWLIDGMTIGSGGFNEVWSSPDGRDWKLEATSTPLGSRQGQVVLLFKGFMWLIGGLDAKSNVGVGDTWYTKNGKDWTKVPVDGGWVGREDHQVLVFKDKLVLFTGMDTNWHWTQDIWIGTLN